MDLISGILGGGVGTFERVLKWKHRLGTAEYISTQGA